MPTHQTQVEKNKMVDKFRSVIILCPGDEILRKVAREKIMISMWVKHESLYMTKSLTHSLCLKQKL